MYVLVMSALSEMRSKTAIESFSKCAKNSRNETCIINSPHLLLIVSLSGDIAVL